MKENRGQEVISRRRLEELKWYRCLEKKVTCSSEGKAQQSGIWAGALKGAAKERGSQKKVR